MKGRKPKPAKLKIADGSRKPARSNPAAAAGVPVCPRWLGPAARAEWRRVAAELAAQGVVAKLDVAVLTAYCTTWERYQQAVKALAKHKSLSYQVVNEAGSVTFRRRPEVGIAEAAEKQLRLLASELGLTQLSRQRMDVQPPEVVDEFEREFGSGSQQHA